MLPRGIFSYIISPCLIVSLQSIVRACKFYKCLRFTREYKLSNFIFCCAVNGKYQLLNSMRQVPTLIIRDGVTLNQSVSPHS